MKMIFYSKIDIYSTIVKVIMYENQYQIDCCVVIEAVAIVLCLLDSKAFIHADDFVDEKDDFVGEKASEVRCVQSIYTDMKTK